MIDLYTAPTPNGFKASVTLEERYYGNARNFRNGGPIVGDGELYSNAGIGLRMFLPIGPIRLDLGLPVHKDEFTGDSPRFQFNMGYKF